MSDRALRSIGLETDIRNGTILGQKSDSKQLYLYRSDEESPVMMEIARLRRGAFLASGLGTGTGNDLDDYDFYYDHIVLWDSLEKEIVGTYRLIPCSSASKKSNNSEKPSLYTESIYQYSNSFKEKYFDETIEVGRMFVNESYWGTKGLDYLWHGMAYYLSLYNDLRYIVCALSVPAYFPKEAKADIATYYMMQYPDNHGFAKAIVPYEDSFELSRFFKELLGIDDKKLDINYLKKD